MTDKEYSRFLRLPVMLKNARKKVEMLEKEAERHGLHDLLENSKKSDRA